ncbi:hypothetical protein JCM24511_09896 [Saitozyma sp. JCM 24511]|nr:hypothetical protein JCM24511_09896 [Saitozyma sp. JCM 24511]
MPDSAFSVHSNQPGHSYWPPTPVARDLAATAAIGPATKGDQKNVVASHSVNGGRRNSLPDDASDHVVIFPLHKDYLLTQSTLFRSLLSSAPDRSHLDLARSLNPSLFARRPDPRLAPSSLRPDPHQSGPTSAPMAAGVDSTGPSSGGKQPDSRGPLRLRGAKLLPTRDGEPCSCWVPLPDPASFGVLLHWIYW